VRSRREPTTAPTVVFKPALVMTILGQDFELANIEIPVAISRFGDQARFIPAIIPTSGCLMSAFAALAQRVGLCSSPPTACCGTTPPPNSKHSEQRS